MRSKGLIFAFLLCAFSVGAVAQTQAPETKPNRTIAPAPADSAKPEFKRRSLPNDTFKPSEEISEDFPVPFPVDI